MRRCAEVTLVRLWAYTRCGRYHVWGYYDSMNRTAEEVRAFGRLSATWPRSAVRNCGCGSNVMAALREVRESRAESSTVSGRESCVVVVGYTKLREI
ncbi:hypothetical protein OH76DRAFT_1189320 [Lentinus brumalis]|uniref:Uncharacterized protein n=1 Tax=Lentinus brumalis TaxID=2498619 RepID=A0A371CTS2_9APHY|nr:hypothetical protein OH76DRAFT_1189320 [Polyporus brumalis]